MRVAIFCSSRETSLVYENIVKQAISILSEYGYTKLAYGGGASGLMGVVLNEGTRLGMNVEGHNLERWKIDRKEMIYDTLVERQRGLIESSGMYVIFPGGVGTMYELFQVLCQNDVDRLSKPVILYNACHLYDPLVDLLYDLVHAKLVDRERLHLYIVHSPHEFRSTLSSLKEVDRKRRSRL